MNKDYLLSRLNIKTLYTDLVPSLKIDGKGKATGLCPFHDDHNPSLHIDFGTGMWKCFPCGAGGDVFKFYMELKGVNFKTALEEIAAMQGISEEKTKQKVVAIFYYHDKDGKVLYKRERVEPGRNGKKKEFFPKHLADSKWVNGRGCEAVLYNLPDIAKSKKVLIVEGEAKVELLREWGLTATCLDSGANSKWRDEYTEILGSKGKVIILPDNDDPGRNYATIIADKLYGKVKQLKVVELPGLPAKGDVVDWEKIEGNDKEKLIEIIKASPEWTPEKEEEDFLSKLETWDDIKSLDVSVEWVVDMIIPKESITVIFGKGGIGKTWLVMDIARCIGEGINYLGHKTIKTPVIYIDFENPAAVLNDRTLKLGDSKNVHFWRISNKKVKPPKLDTEDWIKYKTLPPKGAVLIFDTLRASQNRDENASDQMGNIMERLKELRDMGFTVILLHHTAKNSDKVPKGSTAIVDLADHILGITKVKRGNNGEETVVDDESDDDEAVYRFGFVQKTRYEPYHIHLTLNPERGFDFAPDPQEETLKEMRTLLEEHGELNKTAFANECHKKGLGSKNKLARLVSLGQGRFWDIENKKENNAKVVKPKSRFPGLPDLCKGEKPGNHPEGSATETKEDSVEHNNITGYSSLPEGYIKTEKPTSDTKKQLTIQGATT